MGQVDSFIAKYPTLTQYDKLKELEDKTGYPKVYFFIGFTTIFSLIVTICGGTKLIVDLVGFVYPAYMSFKSMDANKGDCTQWLTYWVVFAFFSITESLAGFLVFLIPFYFLTKTAFILWLYHPQTQGAQIIYRQVLRPVLLPYLEKVKGATKKTE